MMVSLTARLYQCVRVFVSILLLRFVAPAPTNPSFTSTQALSLDTAGQISQDLLTGLPPLANLSYGNKGNCASANKYSSWKAQDWIIEDCFGAVHQLYLSEVFTHPSELFEFTAQGAAATRPDLKMQRTPRKYVNSEA